MILTLFSSKSSKEKTPESLIIFGSLKSAPYFSFKTLMIFIGLGYNDNGTTCTKRGRLEGFSKVKSLTCEEEIYI